uniref:RNase H type-1 domain-containing protein n=1 Tax=Fagus sylvatica TaxID=28930 RepID=A0A2N9F080_FAGSY
MYLQEKLEARLTRWRSKCFSWADRCTLIKSVVQAIPTYTLSAFDVLIALCDKLDATTPIKQISIPAIPKKDKLVWILDSKGNFLVKSAIKTNQSQPIGDVEVNWKSLWKLKLHERYKVLVWRIDNGILPIKAVVATIWFGHSWAIHSCHINVLNSKDILKIICDPPIIATTSAEPKSLREETSIQFATTLDCIWNLKAGVESNVKQLELKWKVTEDGTIKLNVDVAISMDIAAIFVVARNYHGHIMKAWAKLIESMYPSLAEASAIYWALEQAECEKYKSICVESDAKSCIDALSSPLAECPGRSMLRPHIP